MGLHEQARAILMEPTTTVAVAQLDKIHRPVVFIGPVVIFDAAYADIHKNYAAGTQYRHHASVRQPNISVAVAGIAIGQHAFETPPLLDHAGEQFSPPRIERGIESQWSLERDGGSREMRVRGMKGPTVWKTILDGHIIPSKNLELDSSDRQPRVYIACADQE